MDSGEEVISGLIGRGGVRMTEKGIERKNVLYFLFVCFIGGIGFFLFCFFEHTLLEQISSPSDLTCRGLSEPRHQQTSWPLLSNA